MLPPENKPVKELVDEYHVHQQTLYRWRNRAKSKGTVYLDNAGSKQKHSKEMQLHIIIETSPLNNHELSEYCRRKGIYAEEIDSWKKAFINAETDKESKIKQELKDSKAELKLTKKELDRKEKALAEAAALLVLKKDAIDLEFGRGRLTTRSNRIKVVAAIDEAVVSGAKQFKACGVVGISERTYQHWKVQGADTKDGRTDALRPIPANG